MIILYYLAPDKPGYKMQGSITLQTDSKEREFFVKAVSTILHDIDPGKMVKKSVKRRANFLNIKDQNGRKVTSYNLTNFRRVVILGAGKASGKMALSLEEVLGDHLTSGIVNILHSQNFSSSKLEFVHAGHPIPDTGGVRGVRRMLRLIDSPRKEDLFICLISGGGSAMMELPAEGISLRNVVNLTNLLLESGADIHEINTVRKHISQVKGGLLAKKLYPATVLSLIVSDVVGDRADIIASGPTSADKSTFLDAKLVLQKRGIWSKASTSIRRYIESGIRGEVNETPKDNDPVFRNVKNVIIGGNKIALNSAKKLLVKNGFKVAFFTDHLSGESREVAYLFASRLKKMKADSHNVALLAGGETTVTVKGEHGKGGRNQEFVLSASLQIVGMQKVSLISFATDGVDGPTDAAGAYADWSTATKARNKGIDAEAFLIRHDSYNFFKNVGGLILTGATGTNVNDIAIGIKRK